MEVDLKKTLSDFLSNLELRKEVEDDYDIELKDIQAIANGVEPKKRAESAFKPKKSEKDLPTRILPDFDPFKDTYIETNPLKFASAFRKIQAMPLIEGDSCKIEEKFYIKDDFMSLDKIDNPRLSKRTLQKERRKERGKDAGKNWFHMKAPEMTDEIKADLKVLKHRHVIDPKRFYKPSSSKQLPKFFQMGRIVDSAADFYSGRVSKNEKKRSLADSLMAEAKFQQYKKRKMNEIYEKKKAADGTRKYKRNRLNDKEYRMK